MNHTLIKQLCKLPKNNLRMVLFRFLKEKGYKNVEVTEDYIIAEGTLPICLCAHIDTVFMLPPTDFFFDNKESVLWAPFGAGFDDRAGIYSIVQLIIDGFRPSVVFTDLEEQGGVGASQLIKKYPTCPFKKCKAIIQLDRQGEKDSVYYELNNLKFEGLINSYGFKTATGTFTDISVIAPAWGIAAVNLSVGYYNEHTQSEFLRVKELDTTIEKVKRMLRDCNNWKKYHYKKKAIKIQTPPRVCLACGKPLFSLNDCYRCKGIEDDMNDFFYLCSSCFKTFSSEDEIEILPDDKSLNEFPKE